MSNTFLDTIITGNIASGVELMDALVLNGQVHNKSTLAPRPLQFLNLPSQAKEFFANQMLFWKDCSTVFPLDIKDNLFFDSTDPTVYYFIRQTPKNSALKPVLVRVVANRDKTYTITEKVFGLGDRPIVNVLSQDNKYIYCSEAYRFDQVYFHKIPKDFSAAVLSGSVAIGTTYSGVIKYAEDLTTITFIGIKGQTGDGAIQVWIYNKSSHTVARTDWLPGTAVGLTSAWPNCIPTEPSLSGVCYSPIDDAGYVGLGAIEVDIPTNTAKFKSVELTVPGEARVSFEKLRIAGATLRARYFTSGDREYVHVLTHMGYEAVSSTDLSLPKLYIFELTGKYTAILRQTILFDSWFYGSLAINNNQTIFCINSGGVVIYTWDSVDRKMVQTYQFSGSPYEVAVDKLNNVYIVNVEKTAVYRLSQGTPAGTAEVKFDSATYGVSIGEKLPVKISISLKNYMGKYLGRNLKINLYGNCEFEDGTTETVVITDPTSPIEKSVFITGPGEIQAIPSLI